MCLVHMCSESGSLCGVTGLHLTFVPYEWIDGHQIGPEFLGHLTEEGRVIGFLIERVFDCRHATPEDLSLCQHTLAKLHKLGIKHGDTNKHNFLIRMERRH